VSKSPRGHSARAGKASNPSKEVLRISFFKSIFIVLHPYYELIIPDVEEIDRQRRT